VNASPIPVGVAVVECRGHYLIGRRSENASLPGMCEFPGGKCLPNESPRDCAIRECVEETGVLVTPVRLLHRTCFAYSHGTVDLHFWLCRPAEFVSLSEQHSGFLWIPTDQLVHRTFPEANAEVLCILTSDQPDEFRPTEHKPRANVRPQ